MKAAITANQLNGRAIGALFFAGFGAIWLVLGLYAAEKIDVATVSAVAAGLLLLLGAARRLFQQAKAFPKMREDPAQSRAFNRINAAQWIAIATVAIALGRLHLDVYIVSAIAAIVGLHLFPLARLFRYPMHHATAIVMVLWAAICLLAVPLEHLQSATAFGTGIILWTSAAIGLAMGHVAGRQPASPAGGSRSSAVA